MRTPRSALRNDGRVGEIAEGELHAHALGPEPARVAHQAAHRLAARGQAPQQRRADAARWRP